MGCVDQRRQQTRHAKRSNKSFLFFFCFSFFDNLICKRLEGGSKKKEKKKMGLGRIEKRGNELKNQLIRMCFDREETRHLFCRTRGQTDTRNKRMKTKGMMYKLMVEEGKELDGSIHWMDRMARIIFPLHCHSSFATSLPRSDWHLNWNWNWNWNESRVTTRYFPSRF